MPKKEEPNVLVEKDGRIARVTLNRPDKLNTFDFPGQGGQTDQFQKAMDQLERDDNISVVILKGAGGKAFSVGHDLTKVGFIYGMKEPEPGEKLAERPSQRRRLSVDKRFMYDNYMTLMYYPKILISQVQGYCLAKKGLTLASVCDIMICADNAKMGFTQNRLGFAGSGGGVLALFYLTMGMKRTVEMLLTSRIIDGKEAERIGLASLAVPENKLEETVENMAKLICLLPRDGLAIGKASRHLLYDALGVTSSLTLSYITHTMFTNLHYEPDEFLFFKQRRDLGPKGAIHARNELWNGLLDKIYGARSQK